MIREQEINFSREERDFCLKPHIVPEHLYLLTSCEQQSKADRESLDTAITYISLH